MVLKIIKFYSICILKSYINLQEVYIDHIEIIMCKIIFTTGNLCTIIFKLLYNWY